MTRAEVIARLISVSVCVAGIGAVHLHAQAPSEASARSFTLIEALRYAGEHYPTVTAAIEERAATAEGIRVAQAGYLPRLDAMWQTSRSTANNMFGLMLPQSVIPAISGPELGAATSQSVWGSAAGALFTWEPFDFGLRHATVRTAEVAVSRAQADESLARLNVQSAVGAAFLGVVAAEQAMRAADADVARRDVLARAAHALADNQLRPGAEASRADAERAAAQTRAIQARQAYILARATLTRTLGVTDGLVSADAAGLLATAPPPSSSTVSAAAHPLSQAREAVVAQARAQEEVLAQSHRPRVYLQSSVFARGSGANPDRPFDGGLNGLGFERGNWATGIQVAFPNLFDLAGLRARRAAAAASTRAQSARRDEALLMVTTEQQAAAAMVDAARAVAMNTPIQLASAQLSEAQARARYEAGLASIVEVADTQNLLAQAEYQHALSRLDVWRALLAEALAHGDVSPFVRQLSAPEGAR